MLRLLFLALLAVVFFTQIPTLAEKWMASNEHAEATVRQGSPAKSPVNSKAMRVSGKTVLKPDGRGHYFAKAFLNGKPIKVVIDTGASYVALSYEDARRVGVKPRKADFTVPMDTANGRVLYAKVKLRSVRIGGAEERNIEAVIAPKGALDVTLMGMSYLRKLKTFEVRQGQLLLES